MSVHSTSAQITNINSGVVTQVRTPNMASDESIYLTCLLLKMANGATNIKYRPPGTLAYSTTAVDKYLNTTGSYRIYMTADTNNYIFYYKPLSSISTPDGNLNAGKPASNQVNYVSKQIDATRDDVFDCSDYIISRANYQEVTGTISIKMNGTGTSTGTSTGTIYTNSTDILLPPSGSVSKTIGIAYSNSDITNASISVRNYDVDNKKAIDITLTGYNQATVAVSYQYYKHF